MDVNAWCGSFDGTARPSRKVGEQISKLVIEKLACRSEGPRAKRLGYGDEEFHAVAPLEQSS